MPTHPDEQKLTLVEKIHEYDDVYTFIFKPEHPVEFEAGMYAHVRVPEGEEGHKTREFSIASAPSEETVRFSAHTWEGSPYKVKLGSLAIGDTVDIFKIKGEAILSRGKDSQVVLIAGGIGIAPMRSILIESGKLGTAIKPILVHVAHGTYLYEEELAKLPNEQIRITRDELDETLQDVTRKHIGAYYYVSGPPKFVIGIAGELKNLGVEEKNIITDEFTGYEEVVV